MMALGLQPAVRSTADPCLVIDSVFAFIRGLDSTVHLHGLGKRRPWLHRAQLRATTAVILQQGFAATIGPPWAARQRISQQADHFFKRGLRFRSTG